MEVTRNIEEVVAVDNKKTMRVIKGLVAVLIVTTGVTVVGPGIVPFILVMFGGAMAYN